MSKGSKLSLGHLTRQPSTRQPSTGQPMTLAGQHLTGQPSATPDYLGPSIIPSVYLYAHSNNDLSIVADLSIVSCKHHMGI